MSEDKWKTPYYRVTVVETITSWIDVVLIAADADEAKALAEDAYDPDAFHDSTIRLECINAVLVDEEEEERVPLKHPEAG